MDNDALRHRHKKHKKKHDRKHDHNHGKRHRDSDSEGEEQPAPPLPVQVEPWHGMQFNLIDCISDYGVAAPDSCTLRGLARASAPNNFDMSDFARLLGYVRDTFDLDPEMPLVLVVSVRASLARACPCILATCYPSEPFVLVIGPRRRPGPRAGDTPAPRAEADRSAD